MENKGAEPQHTQNMIRVRTIRHFQHYFNYIMVVSFIGRGNRSASRKPPACHKSLTNTQNRSQLNINT